MTQAAAKRSSARKSPSARKPRDALIWLASPADKDFPAAASYLGLSHVPKQAKKLVAALRAAPLTQYEAKDIFRASGLPLLGLGNHHVEKERARIRVGDALSPILLVRDALRGRVVIADGYHRLCAAYSLDEDALIPCRIV